MAFTFTTLKQAIQDYVESNETSFVNNLALIIKQAEDRILKNTQLPVFRKNVTGSLEVGVQYLASPQDFLSAYSLAVDNSGYDYLLFKDVNLIRQIYPENTSTGTPKVYGIFDENYFIVGPTPDQAYDVELHYFHKPESITTSVTGESWLGTNAESTLLYGCLVEAYTYLKGDADLMQLYMQKYAEAIQRLEELGEGYSTTDSYRSGAVRKGRT